MSEVYRFTATGADIRDLLTGPADAECRREIEHLRAQLAETEAERDKWRSFAEAWKTERDETRAWQRRNEVHANTWALRRVHDYLSTWARQEISGKYRQEGAQAVVEHVQELVRQSTGEVR